MMKFVYGLMAAGLILSASAAGAADAAGAGQGAAPAAAETQTAAETGASFLLADPARYRVLYAGEDEVAYADMTTVTGQQTMDYPGSLENVHFTLYVESYKDKVSAMDFARGRLVTQIRKFDVELHANKRDRKYTMTKTLTDVYAVQGASLAAVDFASAPKKWEKIDAEAKDLYFNLYRLERLPQK